MNLPENSHGVDRVLYLLIAVALALTITDRAGAGLWAPVGVAGVVTMWFFHLGPWAVEPPADVILPYASPLVGCAAFAVLLALIGSLLVTAGYATVQWRRSSGQ